MVIRELDGNKGIFVGFVKSYVFFGPQEGEWCLQTVVWEKPDICIIKQAKQINAQMPLKARDYSGPTQEGEEQRWGGQQADEKWRKEAEVGRRLKDALPYMK